MSEISGKKPSEFSEATKTALLNAILPYKSFVGLITHFPHAVGNNPFVIGKKYLIKKYYSGDDFTNIGASTNADEIVFIATGTHAANFDNNSEVYVDYDPTIICLQNNLGAYSIERYQSWEFRLYLEELQVLTDLQKIYMTMNILPDAAPNPNAFDAFAGIEQGFDENERAFIRINCTDWLLNKTPVEIRMYK